MTKPMIQSFLKTILETESYEITCHQCYDAMDQYVDLLGEGAEPEEVLPLVKQHLDCCPDCEEIFQTLVVMIENNRAS